MLDAEKQVVTDGFADLSTAMDLRFAQDAQQIQDLSGLYDEAKISLADLRSQLAGFGGMFVLNNLQKLRGWSPGSTGPLIGGKPPAAFSRVWDANDNLVLSTTGKPGEYDDWITAIHLPIPDISLCRMVYGMLLDDDQTNDQCHEFDAIFVYDGRKHLGGAQIDNSRGGLLNLSKGDGGWIDTAVKVGRLLPGHHELWVDYLIDRAAGQYTYLAFWFDGKRYPLMNTQTAATFPDPAKAWRNNFLTIQLQEDINKLGGSSVTIYDNIRAILL